MVEGYGHNIDRVVYCHLCDWQKECPRGMEEIEFALQTHLREVHGKPLFYRVENETGRKTDIPT